MYKRQALELLLEELYQKFNISKNTNIAKLKNTDFLSDIIDV